MAMHSARTKSLATNSLFGVFFLSAFGWGLLQTWAVEVSASIFVHALIAIPGMAMSGVVLYRYARHWPNCQPASNAQRAGSRWSFDYRTSTWYLMLAVIGIGMSMVVGGGSLFLLTLAVIGLIAVPWARISVCRDHFFIAAAVLGGGAAIGLALSSKPFHPLHQPLAGLVILLTSCVAVLFIVMTHRNQSDRMPEAGY